MIPLEFMVKNSRLPAFCSGFGGMFSTWDQASLSHLQQSIELLLAQACHGRKSRRFCSFDMGMGQNPIPLVNIKIAGKWMFIPLKNGMYRY